MWPEAPQTLQLHGWKSRQCVSCAQRLLGSQGVVLPCLPSSPVSAPFALAGDLRGRTAKPVPSLVCVRGCVQLDPVVVANLAGLLVFVVAPGPS